MRKYVIAAVWVVLMVIVAFAVAIFRWESKTDPAFEKVVREAVAKQINEQIFSQLDYSNIKFNGNVKDFDNRIKAYQKKFQIDPNELTEEDFAKTQRLESIDGEFYNINFLEKFTNLENLGLFIRYPKSEIPFWMKLLAKMGVYDLKERFIIDLSPLRKLTRLKSLHIAAPVKNIKPLSEFHNLQYLYINSDLLSDLKPIENLTNLQTLIISGSKISDIEPIRNLTDINQLYLRDTSVSDIEPIRSMNKIELLDLYRTQVSDIEPISKLTNLENLELIGTKVTDLSPLKNLENLRYLDIRGTKVRDYKPLKTLPKLEQLWVSDLMFQTKEDIEEFQKVLPKVTLRGLPYGGLPSRGNKEK